MNINKKMILISNIFNKLHEIKGDIVKSITLSAKRYNNKFIETFDDKINTKDTN